MRMLLPIAVLLVLGADVQAQQLADPVRPDDVPAVEARLAPAPSVQNVQAGPTEVKPIRSTERRAQAETSTKAVAEEAATQQIPRGFWWLVAAVVVGGLILAVVL